MVDLSALATRFERAAAAAGATGPCDAVFRELTARYGEPHRHYHTLAHIDACLAWLDWFSGSAERSEEVELALWFHDAVYDLLSSVNEARSAALARERLAALGVRSDAIGRVAAHIEATATHFAAPGDSALLVDLDLTILAARANDFDSFERKIRSEYAHVSEATYRAARRRVLEGFLSRVEIYKVAPLRAELESAARANLERRIGELLAPGDAAISVCAGGVR
ncbi:MAG TPA: hypothetical protein VHE30_14255 [Polyangiaceae bacterium]|nr:hypothetical protein [Polyangiaceae bacterium]